MQVNDDFQTTLGTPQVPETEETSKQEYKPSNKEVLRDYEIKLQFLSRGCIVHVGCKSIPFESVEKAMAELNRYVNNAWEVQQEWRKILD